MASLIKVPTFSDHRGNLTVIEKELGFSVNRVYYIYGVNSSDIARGGHKHKVTKQALISVNGQCEINYYDSSKELKTILLDDPSKVLVLEPEDWHTMEKFSKDAVLLVLASHIFDEEDYVYEKD